MCEGFITITMSNISRSLNYDYTLNPFDILISEHLWLADKYVAIFANGYNRSEWKAAALAGITEAASRWALEKSNGAKFSSYAHYWILARARDVWLLGKPSRREGTQVFSSDLVDLLAYEEANACDSFYDIDVPEIDVSFQLEILLADLEVSDRFLLRLRFGLAPFDRDHTYKEIADICQMNRVESAWNSTERALKNLRNKVKHYGLWSILRQHIG